MLSDAYVEYSIKARPRMGFYIKMAVCEMVIAVGLFLLLFGGLGLLIMTVGIAFLVYFAGEAKLEYEYIMTNGSVEIAAIYNASKRKEKLQFELESVLMVVPKDSERISNEKFSRKYNFVSKYGEGQQISVVLEGEKGKMLVNMEPDERCLEHIKTYARNKCHDI